MVMGRSLHHALDRDPIFRAVSSYYGVTTADGTPATLICNALLLSNDFITGKVILLDSGASAFETRGATVFAPGTGTITVAPAFSAPVLAGTGFYILTQQSLAAALAVIVAAIAAMQADVGDASTSILGSLYGILGNPAVDLATSIAAILAAIAGMGGAEIAPTNGTLAANWQVAEQNLFTVGVAGTAQRVSMLVVGIQNLVGHISIRFYMLVNGVERRIYPIPAATTFGAVLDAPAIPVINSTMGINGVLRITVQSDNAADNGQNVTYQAL